MHQLRVQAASRSRPILGDRQYGSTVPFGPQTEDERERWIALHARSLTFRHPKTRRIVSVVAPLPEAWRGLGLDESDAPRS
jgi:23S rRNA-/tRNA-specific pseudouridylate synthase